MAAKPKFIQLFEKQTGITLKQVSEKEIKEKESWLNSSIKGTYCTDNNNNVTALSVDNLPRFLWQNLPLHELNELKHLGIRSCTISDYRFLSDFKGLTSLNLSLNNIQDYISNCAHNGRWSAM